MENMDLIFADNNEIIVDALARMIRDQCEEIEDLQHSIETLNRDLREANKLNEMLKADMALAKKVAKVTKVTKVAKEAIPVPVKRKPGRPKKVVG
jgi:predicted RNase H-like nuclease (RuvC/YqgF family)